MSELVLMGLVLSFFITVIALVAIAYRQRRVAKKAIKSLGKK